MGVGHYNKGSDAGARRNWQGVGAIDTKHAKKESPDIIGALFLYSVSSRSLQTRRCSSSLP
jgi:hypothetical protein